MLDLLGGPSKDFPGCGWLTTSSFARRDPKTMAAFRRAIAKAAKPARSGWPTT